MWNLLAALKDESEISEGVGGGEGRGGHLQIEIHLTNNKKYVRNNLELEIHLRYVGGREGTGGDLQIEIYLTNTWQLSRHILEII